MEITGNGDPEGGGVGAREAAAGEWRDFNIGPRVTAVFTAAEKAAEHMMTMARAEADDLRRRAEHDAQAYLEEQRAKAEAEAARLLDEAHARALAVDRATEADARRKEEAVRERHQLLLEEARLLEERLEWAQEGLRNVASRLAEVRPEPSYGTAPTVRPPEPDVHDAEPGRSARS